jgi:hypothetical protein
MEAVINGLQPDVRTTVKSCFSRSQVTSASMSM